MHNDIDFGGNRVPRTTATRTEYTYDNMYRLAKAETDVSTGNTLSASYGYTNDLLTSIKTGSTTYSFTYGEFALRKNIKIGNRTLASYTYTSRNNFLDTLAYGNGDSVQYTYDKQGRITKQTYEDGDTVTYQYDNNGALASITDSGSGMTTKYYYDFTDRLVKYTETSDDYTNTVTYQYDASGNVTANAGIINGGKRTIGYAYDKDNRIITVANALAREDYTYDAYSRISRKTLKHDGNTILTDTLTYTAPTSTSTSGQIAKLTTQSATGYGVTYTYTYDDNGNILTINDGTFTNSYGYDSANQLVRENNRYANKTWIWEYDDAGNILSKTQYNYTTGNDLGTPTDEIIYAYTDSLWGDLLTAYDGQTLSYDGIGNLTSDGAWTYTWEHGRELASMSNGSATWEFTYNADGLRTKRTNGSVTYHYIYRGNQLARMTRNNVTMNFIYDANGTPMVLVYNGVNYYYMTNAQGDVTAILDNTGAPVVTYIYDAYGQTRGITGSMANTIGVHNPFRYRGYVWDSETGLFYLRSRYYDPQIGRFINADALVSTGQGVLGNNMFAYCLNNPAIHADRTGNEAVRIDLTDQDRNGDGIPDEAAGGNSGGTNPSGNSGYNQPRGGGGVSSSHQVGDVTVDFGHGGRHIDASQHDVSQIESAIANDVVNRPPSYDHASSVHDFCYDGLSLYYSYFTRSPIHINVGTYYVEMYLG